MSDLLHDKTEVLEWDNYWEGSKKDKRLIYNLIASFYRNLIIKRYLNYILRSHFSKGSKVLHAGCGGGEVDKDIVEYVNITACDFSKNALKRYRQFNSQKVKTKLADIRDLPFKDTSFDGVYNLGVLEHFSEEEGIHILKGFNRVLKPKGKIVLFWPPEYGLSVIFFKVMVFISKNILRVKDVKFHPNEVNRIRSKAHVQSIIGSSEFKLLEYRFGISDLFTYCVIVAEKA